MYKKILPILLIIIPMLSSCRSRAASMGIPEKLREIQKLLFVYDLDAIDFDAMERVDTLFLTPDIFSDDNIKRMAYVVTGDCSFCIASLMDFLATWESGDGLPEPALMIKGDNDELVKYYLAQQDKNYLMFPRKVIASDIYAQDGAYLIINGRIIKYIPWSID